MMRPGTSPAAACPECGAPAGMACVEGPAMDLRPATTHEARRALRAYAQHRMVERDTDDHPGVRELTL